MERKINGVGRALGILSQAASPQLLGNAHGAVRPRVWPCLRWRAPSVPPEVCIIILRFSASLGSLFSASFF